MRLQRNVFRAGSYGWVCSSPAVRSSTKSGNRSVCTRWRRRMPRPLTCARRSKNTKPGCSWSSCAPPATTMTRTRSISARSASSSDLISSLRFDRVSRASYTAHVRGSNNTPNCLHWARTRCSGRSWTRWSRDTPPSSLTAEPTSHRQSAQRSAPVVADLESDIEQVEGTVFSGAVAPTERIYDLRREVTNFYRAVHPLLAVLTGVERNVDDAELRPYLRDVRDHLHLISEEVAAQKDLLATVLQANMAVISVEQTRVSMRQNSTMEQLTILATVFLPLTFITGFFGQNFAWLTDNITGFPRFAVLGIGGLLVPLALLWAWMRRNQRATTTAET